MVRGTQVGPALAWPILGDGHFGRLFAVASFTMFDVGITLGSSVLRWLAQAVGSRAVMYQVVAVWMLLAEVVAFTVILPAYARTDR